MSLQKEKPDLVAAADHIARVVSVIHLIRMASCAEGFECEDMNALQIACDVADDALRAAKASLGKERNS